MVRKASTRKVPAKINPELKKKHFSEEELDTFKRKRLQTLAKAHQIKANLSNDVIKQKLLEAMQEEA